MPNYSRVLKAKKAEQRTKRNFMMVVGLLTLIFFAVTYYNSRPQEENNVGENNDFPSLTLADPTIEIITTASGLMYQDLVVGDGAVAAAGQTVSVHYTGWLTNDTKFDSSVDRDTPFEFALGAGRVIRGWDEGVVGMRVGGTRLLLIPSDLAYGESGSGAIIPPGATLVFQVELLEIK